MEELSLQIAELEKKVKRITRSKQKKHMSAGVKKHFEKVLAGIDELNKQVLNYNGTNILLYAKLNEGSMHNYIQY